MMPLLTQDVPDARRYACRGMRSSGGREQLDGRLEVSTSFLPPRRDQPGASGAFVQPRLADRVVGQLDRALEVTTRLLTRRERRGTPAGLLQRVECLDLDV